ncbi:MULTISPECIES: LacI family DNA-binding transcriptional regulator [Paenibacillus]|uniref:LacI family DNA-binding transcriptional regulator n=1 Tax=Paenibacillus cucumis (ex Kampfer et al. 2016) TaxID=1776858 RepID=A0ABS7KIR4_9BACL|nr:LacI family DNA-binding transcriptional regulator [Paenibacillus cucumis (ex Kampfer et al. 2016)]MBY0204053.1 LacI family DNA-binding transcriptional regulator [Paenibacillus cucumis (ex Kampfer et al. 2016)]MDP9697915.1 LacI family transcriptional regulator [Paenibacillus intestini]
MTTIKDVANLAGVSVATVSRVINDRGYVHADTRKKVEEAVKALHFSPNEVARSLYTRKSKLIGLLLPDIANPYFPQLARGVEDRMQEQDYRLIFGNSDEDERKEHDYIQTFIQNNVVGVISSTNYPHSSIYEKLKIPVVFLDRTSLERPSVYADGREGGRLAAKEIIKRGSKRITVMQGPSHIRPAQDRFEGAIEVIREAGLDHEVIQTTSFSFNEAGVWAEELFRKFPDTDGVIASNDIAAMAVLHEAYRIGRNVPNDVQVIGFDDIPMSGLLSPALSTIRQPAYEMGREAAGLLIQLVEQNKMENKNIQLPVSFIERGTTRKVRNDG